MPLDASAEAPFDPPVGMRRAVEAIVAAGPPGAHLSVAVAAGQRWDACAGHAQLFDETGPRPVELTLRHAHDLGSVTKIAGTTAMLVALVSGGTVTVDDRLGRYLAGLPTPLADATLRDLLTHRAGLWEWWPTYLSADDPIATAAGNDHGHVRQDDDLLLYRHEASILGPVDCAVGNDLNQTGAG